MLKCWTCTVEVDGWMLRRLGIDIAGAVCHLNVSQIWLLFVTVLGIVFSSIKAVKSNLKKISFSVSAMDHSSHSPSLWLCHRMVVCGWRSTASVIFSAVSIVGRRIGVILIQWLSSFQRVGILLWNANRNYSSYRLVISRWISGFNEKCA